MDFVYICRSGENEELRYSIRSVVKNFPDANIWVVGGKPKWYIGNYVEVDQNKNKYTNALNNLSAICKSTEISESFIFMNDDFFILKPFNLSDSFHGGLLSDKISRYKELTPDSGYVRKLNSTNEKLFRLKINNPLDYELHVPMLVEKSKLNRIINKYPDMLWRSLYGNIYKVGGKEIQDVKIYSNPIYKSRSFEINKDSVFASTEDYSFSVLVKTFFGDILSQPSNNEVVIGSSTFFS